MKTKKAAVPGFCSYHEINNIPMKLNNNYVNKMKKYIAGRHDCSFQIGL
jgi:hypothetical protein